MDRNFCFSSSATNFLQSNGFDVGAVFTKGVPYLSEQEEVEARERYDQRMERNASIPTITFDPSDTGTLDFYRSARSTINEWIEAKAVSYLCIVTAQNIFSIHDGLIAQYFFFSKSDHILVLVELECFKSEYLFNVPKLL